MQRSRGTRDRRRTSGRPSRRLLERWADERLVELVLTGDEAAFEELFERHAADALWFARELLGSWGEAEEAVRHSFAAAHAYLASRDPDVEFAPWLRTILSNHCLSMLQARAPDPGELRDAPVIDLAAWRRKRRRLLRGVLPLSPSAGLHEGVLAACGIGSAGAGAAAVPLLGGTLAKVAVVAVLATGVGVAGDVATHRGEPSESGVQVVAEHAPSGAPTAAPAAGGADHVAGDDPSVRTAPGVPVIGALPLGRELGDRRTPADGGVPAVGSPAAPASGGAEVPVAAAPIESPATPIESPDLGSAGAPVGAAVEAVKDLVSANGSAESAPAPQQPVEIDLLQIGDHPGMSSVSPPVDVSDLLAQVAAVRVP